MVDKQSIALLVPAYNAAKFLPRLIESARRQSTPFDEIVVYDDCSQDNTAEVAESLGARVLQGPSNVGCTHGKMILAGSTTCEWMHFHDADDLLLPNFMDRARHWVNVPDVDLVFFGCEERLEESGEVLSVSRPNDARLHSEAVAETIRCKHNAISGLYRRQAFLEAGGFDLDPQVLYNEDQAGHCKLARAGLRIRGDSAVTVLNLRQSTSMWTANRDKAAWASYEVLVKSLHAPNGARYSKVISERLWAVAAYAAGYDDWKLAERAVTLASRLGPVPESSGSFGFRSLARLSAFQAIRLREYFIRQFKPYLRATA